MSDTGTRATLNANDVGPYPKTEGEVTADSLIRYYLALVSIRCEESITAFDLPTTAENLRVIKAASDSFVQSWTVLALLRQVRLAAPDIADSVALSLWQSWEDGGSMPEFLWEWARDEGVDPDARIVAISGTAA